MTEEDLGRYRTTTDVGEHATLIQDHENDNAWLRNTRWEYRPVLDSQGVSFWRSVAVGRNATARDIAAIPMDSISRYTVYVSHLLPANCCLNYCSGGGSSHNTRFGNAQEAPAP